MPTDRWDLLDRLFQEALEQPDHLRAEFLAQACGADVGLRDEVSSLLGAATAPSDFLSTPALEVFARQISHEGWSVHPGERIGFYTVERRLGVGGMGEVWRGRDERLGRDVAIKVLLPGPSAGVERVHALQHEARAAGALNHPNVLTVYDVGEHRGVAYLVTECLEGQSLRQRLASGRLSTDEALEIALHVARGLSAAHRRGIVHRDLKPENVFIVQDGGVKILDFGLATLHDESEEVLGDSRDELRETPRRPLGGTAGYMAPEQLRGEKSDARADLFALGALLHEMLAGRRPFTGNGALGTLNAVLTEEPPELSRSNPDVSPLLSGIVRRCLAKSPAERFASATEVESALVSVVAERNRPPPPSLLTHLRRPAVFFSVLLGVAAIAAGAWRWHLVTARARWARTLAPVETRRLLDRQEAAQAFLLARRAHEIEPDDPYLRQLWLDASAQASVTTIPEGADVELAPYRGSAQGWVAFGRTPLERVPVPQGVSRLRIRKAGFQTIEVTMRPGRQLFRLDPPDQVPPGMVRVVGGREPAYFGEISGVDDFWIDKFEVTNRQFKQFVDQGGYRRPDYWPQTFSDGRRSLGWEEAVDRFRDRTGQHGPSTWKSGTFEEGKAEFPVEGVSWYEAAAYAAFAGKSLPTFYHWYRAANLGRFGDMLAVSNFDGKGAAAVGSYGGIGPFGTFDMAGNVKEWCWNETPGGRFLLGAAWNESPYEFISYDPKNPFEREPGYGFRLAKFDKPLPKELLAPKQPEVLGRDLRKVKPVGDEIFEVYRRQYAYDPAPLNAVIEATEDTELWRKHTVEIDAAHGGQRLRAFLFLPKRVAPPYQSVILFPAGDAFVMRSSGDLSLAWGGAIIRSGRALLYPVYSGTFERRTSLGEGPHSERELFIAWSRELGRAIDYLESRPDIDQGRLAFYGVSGGAEVGVILSGIERRLKASILQGGISGDFGVTPETDPVNYAPRLRSPTLLLNGRYDFETPFETAQVPLFDLIGAEHKRHAVFNTGHALPPAEVELEIRAWLDRYLGPVSERPAAE